MLDFLPEFLRTPAAFVVVLGVLVFIHELGHYLAAVVCGVRVEAFSIGFGRAFASWTSKRSGTVWRLSWIPLGGYVKLHGQERPEDVSDEVRARWEPGRTFHEKSLARRAFIIAAGPLANFALAAVLFIGLSAVEGKQITVPVVGQVLPGSAAEQAGLREGDRFISVAGEKMATFEDLQRVIGAHPGATVAARVLRGGAEIDLSLTPQARSTAFGKVGVLGVQGGPPEFRKLSLAQAVPAGLQETWDITVQTLDGVWKMITTRGGASDLGGPLRIAQLSGKVASLGFGSVVTFIAVLSVNLGLINLFPIPVLDGGHLMFYLAEAVRGRPLPPRAQEMGYQAGFALLIGLFVFATWNDLGHIGVFRWVAGLIG